MPGRLPPPNVPADIGIVGRNVQAEALDFDELDPGGIITVQKPAPGELERPRPARGPPRMGAFYPCRARGSGSSEKRRSVDSK
jgi:hypothetical protein